MPKQSAWKIGVARRPILLICMEKFNESVESQKISQEISKGLQKLDPCLSEGSSVIICF